MAAVASAAKEVELEGCGGAGSGSAAAAPAVLLLGVGLLVLALLVLVLAAVPLLRLLSQRLLLSLLAMFIRRNFSRGGGRKNATPDRLPSLSPFL